jgi:hypothetical protein
MFYLFVFIFSPFAWLVGHVSLFLGQEGTRDGLQHDGSKVW